MFNVSTVFVFGKDGQYEISRNFVLAYNVVYDVVVIILFLILAEYSIVMFKKEDYQWVLKHPHLENFTVEVTRLPLNANYRDVKEHFESIVLDKINPIIDQKNEEIEDNEEKLETSRDPIHDVQVVTTTRQQLTFAITLANLVKTAEHLEAKCYLAQQQRAEEKISQRRFDAIVREYTDAVEKVKDFWAKEGEIKANRSELRTIKAFVTFKSIQVQNLVLEEYNRRIRCRGCCASTDPELLLGNRKIKVQPAVSPFFLKWEHMEYKQASRRTRGCASIVAIILVLLFSSISLVLLGTVEDSDLLGVLSSDQQDIIDGSDCGSFNSTADFIDEFCSDIQSIESGTDEECLVALHCNCEERVSGLDSGVFDDPICRQFVLDDIIDVAILAGSGLLVTIFNIVLEIYIVSTVRFEKEHDRTKEERKLFFRLFIATYINTALVKLVQNLDLETLLDVELPDFFGGQFIDFDNLWYDDVGYDLTIIALTSILGPHVFTFMRYVYSLMKRRFVKPISPEDMEKLYLGPQFLLPLRFAQIVVTICFTLTYSAGIPLLYFTASVSCLAAFLVDKFFLLKFYRRPPQYDNSIVVFVCRGMKYAIILHTFFAMLIFSDPVLFPVDEDDTSILGNINNNPLFDELNNSTDILENSFVSRITTGPVLLLTLVFILLVVYQILVQFEIIFLFLSKWTLRCTKFILRRLVACCCCCCRKTGEEEDDLLKELDELERLEREKNKVNLDDVEVMGLESYNILANPTYAQRIKLKGGQSYKGLLAEKAEIHSTADVLRYLERGDSRRQGRFVFQRGESARTKVTKGSKRGRHDL